MEDASDRITEKVQALSDLELAVLICLVADQHCIIEAEKEVIGEVQEELKLVSTARSRTGVRLIATGRVECVWAHLGCAGLR
jgi:hypothetical protein